MIWHEQDAVDVVEVAVMAGASVQAIPGRWSK
mgnify:CR=1 FL=1